MVDLLLLGNKSASHLKGQCGLDGRCIKEADRTHHSRDRHYVLALAALELIDGLTPLKQEHRSTARAEA